MQMHWFMGRAANVYNYWENSRYLQVETNQKNCKKKRTYILSRIISLHSSAIWTTRCTSDIKIYHSSLIGTDKENILYCNTSTTLSSTLICFTET